ncbi:MAG: hypothetical protein ACHQHP_01230 [Bacteroidia bacterium]
MILPKIIPLLKENTYWFFRIVLLFAFVGHGLVNLGLSSGVELHVKIIKSFHFLDACDPYQIAKCFAVLDFLFAIGIILRPSKIIVIAAIAYLFIVGFAVWNLFFTVKDSPFGIAENMRRFPWIFYLLYMYYVSQKNVHKYHFLRIGISFAFLAHGAASLGLLGFNGGHIELAAQVVPADKVKDFVFYSGISDSILGMMLITGIGSRVAAYIGIPWLIFVVALSFGIGIPEGIFRSGFLLSLAYVAIDKRCHEKTVLQLFKKQNKQA